jgi:hypothetical protein
LSQNNIAAREKLSVRFKIVSATETPWVMVMDGEDTLGDEDHAQGLN